MIRNAREVWAVAMACAVIFGAAIVYLSRERLVTTLLLGLFYGAATVVALAIQTMEDAPRGVGRSLP